MSEQNYQGKLDEQTLIFRHLDRLSRLSTEIEDMYEDNWQIYAHRFQMGISMLESLLQPLIGEEFEDWMDEIEEEYGGTRPKDYEKRVRVNREILDKLIMLLHKNNAYWERSEELVIDEDEEKKAETIEVD